MKRMSRAPRIALAFVAVLLCFAIFPARGQTTRSAETFQIRLVADKNESQSEPLPMLDHPDQTLAVSKRIELDTHDLQSAAASTQDNRPAVEFTFTDAGGEKFKRFTAAHIGRRAAFVIDGKILSAPTILDPIGRSGVISLGKAATQDDAKALAQHLNEAIDQWRGADQK